MKSALVGPVFALFAFAMHTDVEAPAFTPDDILGWQSKAFRGETHYEAASIDGQAAVRASCDGSASWLLLERPIDLEKTPVVEWSWGVAGVFDGDADEERKAGDDYPARLYFVHRGGFNPFAIRAISYVWASHKPVGADWTSPYTSQVHLVAVQSGPPDGAGPWVTQRRNLRDDFRRYHGLDLKSVDGIAIMTDCDDHPAKASAWYGGLRFLHEDGRQS